MTKFIGFTGSTTSKSQGTSGGVFNLVAGGGGIVAKFTRTLPAPSATISGGFVFLLSAGWFTDADQGAAGSPIDGGTNSLANGGGDMKIFSDAATTTQLPIEVVSFVTGGSPDAQIWVRTPSYTTGDTITIGKDDTQTVQPAVGAAFGRNATWADFELVIHQGTSTDSAGNHAPVLNGSPSLTAMNWGGDGYLLDTLSKYISIPHAAALNIERIYSIDLWLDNVAGVTNQTYVDKVNSGNSTGFRFLAGGANLIRTRHPNLSAANLTGSDSDVAIKRISSDFDDVTRANIKNGAVVNSDTPSGTVTNNTDDLYIGFTPTGPDFFNATLGDFWLSKTSRTINQKASEYTNQNDPDNFGTSSEYVLVGGGGLTLVVPSITSGESFGLPDVILNTAYLLPSAITTAESFGVPTVASLDQFIQAISVSSLEAFGEPLILTGGVTLAPTSITSQESLGTPFLVYSQLVLVDSITSEESFGIAIISDGVALVIPVGDRDTYQKIAEYLRATDKFVSYQNNEILLEWLRSEGIDEGSFNDSFKEYWNRKGYVGAYNDRWKSWKGE